MQGATTGKNPDVNSRAETSRPFFCDRRKAISAIECSPRASSVASRLPQDDVALDGSAPPLAHTVGAPRVRAHRRSGLGSRLGFRAASRRGRDTRNAPTRFPYESVPRPRRRLRPGRITQGWHPNFLPGSDHGDTPEQVIAYCRTQFPGLPHRQGPLLHGAHHGLGRPRRVGDRRRFPASDLLPGRPRPTPARVRHLAASGLLRGRHLLSLRSRSSFPGPHPGDALRPWPQGSQLPSHLRRRERPVSGLLRRDQGPLVLDTRRSSEAGPPGRGTREVLEELAVLVTSRGFAFESFEALVDRLPRVG